MLKQDVTVLKQDVAVLKQEAGLLNREFALMGHEFTLMQRDMAELKHGFATQNQTITQYHASVMGHGMLLTEMDERLLRVERHLDLSPLS